MDTKICKKCGQEKSIGDFPYAARCKDNRSARCRSCKSERMKQYRHKKIMEEPIEFRKKEANKMREFYRTHPIKNLLSNAKQRAKQQKVPCTITDSDIIIPEKCPAIGIVLEKGIGKLQPSSPTLDKIIPELGYVPGNVAVISLRANQIKNNATFDELEGLYKWWSSVKSNEIADIHNQG